MDDIKVLHNLSLEWGCVTNLLDRIIAIEDSIDGGWPELTDMVVDAMTAEGEKKDPESVFFNLYGFMMHLYFRIKDRPEKAPFNQYSEQEDCFWVKNYSYTTFVWAREHGFTDGIDNLIIKIPKASLSEKQIKSLQSRCKAN